MHLQGDCFFLYMLSLFKIGRYPRLHLTKGPLMNQFEVLKLHHAEIGSLPGGTLGLANANAMCCSA